MVQKEAKTTGLSRTRGGRSGELRATSTSGGTPTYLLGSALSMPWLPTRSSPPQLLRAGRWWSRGWTGNSPHWWCEITGEQLDRPEESDLSSSSLTLFLKPLKMHVKVSEKKPYIRLRYVICSSHFMAPRNSTYLQTVCLIQVWQCNVVPLYLPFPPWSYRCSALWNSQRKGPWSVLSERY